jgi:hypothetical protein
VVDHLVEVAAVGLGDRWVLRLSPRERSTLALYSYPSD